MLQVECAGQQRQQGALQLTPESCCGSTTHALLSTNVSKLLPMQHIHINITQQCTPHAFRVRCPGCQQGNTQRQLLLLMLTVSLLVSRIMTHSSLRSSCVVHRTVCLMGSLCMRLQALRYSRFDKCRLCRRLRYRHLHCCSSNLAAHLRAADAWQWSSRHAWIETPSRQILGIAAGSCVQDSHSTAACAAQDLVCQGSTQ